jgi:hypothetical protein
MWLNMLSKKRLEMAMENKTFEKLNKLSVVNCDISIVSDFYFKKWFLLKNTKYSYCVRNDNKENGERVYHHSFV